MKVSRILCLINLNDLIQEMRDAGSDHTLVVVTNTSITNMEGQFRVLATFTPPAT